MRPPTVRHSSADSARHGPAITVSGAALANSLPARVNEDVGMCLFYGDGFGFRESHTPAAGARDVEQPPRRVIAAPDLAWRVVEDLTVEGHHGALAAAEVDRSIDAERVVVQPGV